MSDFNKLLHEEFIKSMNLSKIDFEYKIDKNVY